MTVNKIEKKITGFAVKNNDVCQTPIVPVGEIMHEGIVRPELLVGSTYKIKSPSSDHALYVTINDYLLNEGLENESRHPFEIFINSKSMENFQWVLALTRLMSAVFRKGGEVTFIVDELSAIFDPRGGYFKKGIWMPSLVAEIGEVIKKHLIFIEHSTPSK